MHLADVQSHSQICSQRQKGPDPRQGPSAAAITASSPSDAAAAAVAGSVLESVTCGACGQLVEEDVKSELMSHKGLSIAYYFQITVNQFIIIERYALHTWSK